MNVLSSAIDFGIEIKKTVIGSNIFDKWKNIESKYNSAAENIKNAFDFFVPILRSEQSWHFISWKRALGKVEYNIRHPKDDIPETFLEYLNIIFEDTNLHRLADLSLKLGKVVESIIISTQDNDSSLFDSVFKNESLALSRAMTNFKSAIERTRYTAFTLKNQKLMLTGKSGLLEDYDDCLREKWPNFLPTDTLHLKQQFVENGLSEPLCELANRLSLLRGLSTMGIFHGFCDLVPDWTDSYRFKSEDDFDNLIHPIKVTIDDIFFDKYNFCSELIKAKTADGQNTIFVVNKIVRELEDQISIIDGIYYPNNDVDLLLKEPYTSDRMIELCQV